MSEIDALYDRLIRGMSDEELDQTLQQSKPVEQTQIKRDPTSELILNLGPALLGAFSGETGASVAAKSGKESREYVDGIRKQEQELEKQRMKMQEARDKADQALLLARERQRAQDERFEKSLDQRERLAAASREQQEKSRALQIPARQEAQMLRQEQVIEKDVQKLADKVEPFQRLAGSISAVEDKLGFSLDDAETTENSLTVKGEKVDLPGKSIPLIGRVSAYSPKATDLQSAIAKVFNVELKDRSGAAVTTPELERLKEEFGSGRYNTEAQLIGALKRYKAEAQKALKNKEAAFKPEVRAVYQERGGMLQNAFKTPSNQTFDTNEEIESEKRRQRILELRAKKGGQ